MNDDINMREIEELRGEILDFLMEKTEDSTISHAVIFNSILGILIQLVEFDSDGDIDKMRDLADKIKSAIIDYGVANEG